MEIPDYSIGTMQAGTLKTTGESYMIPDRYPFERERVRLMIDESLYLAHPTEVCITGSPKAS